MVAAQETLNVQDFAGMLASELSYLVELSSSAIGLTGKQISDCASDVLRIDFRCSDVPTTIESLPASIRSFLLHAIDNPEMRTAIGGSISRLEGVAAGKM